MKKNKININGLVTNKTETNMKNEISTLKNQIEKNIRTKYLVNKHLMIQ